MKLYIITWPTFGVNVQIWHEIPWTALYQRSERAHEEITGSVSSALGPHVLGHVIGTADVLVPVDAPVLLHPPEFCRQHMHGHSNRASLSESLQEAKFFSWTPNSF